MDELSANPITGMSLDVVTTMPHPVPSPVGWVKPTLPCALAALSCCLRSCLTPSRPPAPPAQPQSPGMKPLTQAITAETVTIPAAVDTRIAADTRKGATR